MSQNDIYYRKPWAEIARRVEIAKWKLPVNSCGGGEFYISGSHGWSLPKVSRQDHLGAGHRKEATLDTAPSLLGEDPEVMSTWHSRNPPPSVSMVNTKVIGEITRANIVMSCHIQVFTRKGHTPSPPTFALTGASRSSGKVACLASPYLPNITLPQSTAS